MSGEGQEAEGGVFTGDTSKVVFAFSAMIEESSDNLGKLLTVLGF
jgi:hypothetical protein